jgi:proline iminopeptidase
MIHGRYDLICPISQANIVKKALPHATIYIVPDAGHSMHEKGTRRQSTRMTRRMFSQYPTRKKARE